MSKDSTVQFNPTTAMLSVPGWTASLHEVKRLWSVVAVFPGMPDETSSRCVFELSDGIVLSPSIQLTTPQHVQALKDWGESSGRLFRLVRHGWPLTWSTLTWSLCAMRRKADKFSLATWQLVQLDGDIQGPVMLDELLRDG